MFTNNKTSYNGNDKVLIEAACLSTDTKPTTGIANGSACIEMDTGKTFMFNEEGAEWEELPDSSGSGGGGGGSDSSTAEVTFINTMAGSDMPYDVLVAECDDDYGAVIVAQKSVYDSLTLTMPLYNGKSLILFQHITNFDANVMPTFTGQISFEDDGLLIEGDGSITIKGSGGY